MFSLFSLLGDQKLNITFFISHNNRTIRLNCLTQMTGLYKLLRSNIKFSTASFALNGEQKLKKNMNKFVILLVFGVVAVSSNKIHV